MMKQAAAPMLQPANIKIRSHLLTAFPLLVPYLQAGQILEKCVGITDKQTKHPPLPSYWEQVMELPHSPESAISHILHFQKGSSS